MVFFRSLWNTCLLIFLDKLIEKFNPLNFDKWRKYFQLKHRFYSAYAYAYLGESFLNEDKCGEAIRACKEGIKCFEMAEELCFNYSKSAGPGKKIILKKLKNNFLRFCCKAGKTFIFSSYRSSFG